MSEAMNKHPDADVMINFASLRSAYDATLEAMQFPQVSSTSTQFHCFRKKDFFEDFFKAGVAICRFVRSPSSRKEFLKQRPGN